MSLVSGINALAVRIAAEIRDAIKPRLIPPGGTLGQVLAKGSNSDHQMVWRSLHAVATSGDYDDLNNKPALFSGSYDDLNDKPAGYDGGTY